MQPFYSQDKRWPVHRTSESFREAPCMHDVAYAELCRFVSDCNKLAAGEFISNVECLLMHIL